MRFQALMPDVLHWLGITKIDNMISMSDMYAFPMEFSAAYILTSPTQETRCDRRFRHPDSQALRPPRYACPYKSQRHADARGTRPPHPHGFTSRNRRQDRRRIFHQRKTGHDTGSIQDRWEGLGRGGSLTWYAHVFVYRNLKWYFVGYEVTRRACICFFLSVCKSSRFVSNAGISHRDGQLPPNCVPLGRQIAGDVDREEDQEYHRLRWAVCLAYSIFYGSKGWVKGFSGSAFCSISGSSC
jgi:hypothetical protein